VKIAAVSLPNQMVVFFRNAVGLAALGPLIWRIGAKGLRTKTFSLHLLRGLAGLSAMYCFFFAISRLHLADAVVLNYTIPLFIPVIAWLWIKEPIPRHLWICLLVGFVGVIFVAKPGLGVFDPAAFAALGAGILAGWAQVAVRRLTRTEPTVRIVFYFALIGTAVSFVPALWVWKNPTPGLWGLLIMIGVLATVAQLFLTKAFSYAPAGQIGPFIYASVVFAGVLDWGLWGKLPDKFSIFGALLVCLAGVLTIRMGGKEVVPVPLALDGK